MFLTAAAFLRHHLALGHDAVDQWWGVGCSCGHAWSDTDLD